MLYRTPLKIWQEYLTKKEIRHYINEKLREEQEHVHFFYEKKKKFVADPDIPEWWRELCVEIIGRHIATHLSNIKALEFKDRMLYQKKNQPSLIDKEVIKAIPIADIMPTKPTHKSVNREFYKSPFRNEANASLVVYQDSNSWYDFGESAGGDVIDLYMRINKVSFKEAIKELSGCG